MFERFRTSYPALEGDHPGVSVGHPVLQLAPGLTDLFCAVGGMWLGDGIVRLHDSARAKDMTALVTEYFPGFAGTILVFGQDWLGRQFAINASSLLPVPGVLLFESGDGAFEVDLSIEQFLEEGLVNEPDLYLDRELFRQWRASTDIRLQADQCVGFRIPLALGGPSTVDNLEVTDLAVYWSISSQIRARLE